MLSTPKQRHPNRNRPAHHENDFETRDDQAKRRRRGKVRKVYLIVLATLYIGISLAIYSKNALVGPPGSIQGGFLGHFVDTALQRYTLRVRLKKRAKLLKELNLQLPISEQIMNQKGIMNIPQSTVEQLLVRSMRHSIDLKRALVYADQWKGKRCKESSAAIPKQILQPNFGSWFRPIIGRDDVKRVHFSEQDSYQLIKQDFPTVFPLYKRTKIPDERVLIWSICSIYQYGGYFYGNTTRILAQSDDAKTSSGSSSISTKQSTPCTDFGFASLNGDSLIELAASPRHPQLKEAIHQLSRWDQEFSIASFIKVIADNLGSTDFIFQVDNSTSEQVLALKIQEVTVKEVATVTKKIKTIKEPIHNKLLAAGCLAGWLCGRCLRLPFRGTYASCKSFCSSCLEEIICDKKETLSISMDTITLEVIRHGPKRPHIIPKIIHQTYFEDLTTDRYAQLVRFQNTWKSSGWEYRFYDDNDIRNYIIKHFPPRVLDAFEAVKPGAFKADLFRYLVLLKDGGIYADSDVVLNTNLDLFVTPNLSFFAPIDIAKHCIWNGLIGSAPGHPIVAKAAEKGLTNILNRADYYDVERAVCRATRGSPEIWKLRLLPVLTITGPCLLGVAMNEVLQRNPLANYDPGWVNNADDPTAAGDVLLLQASKCDMGAFRITDIDRGITIASTNMEGMLPTDKDAFEAEVAEVASEAKAELNHYSKSEDGVDIFGSERVYVDKYVANEVIRLSL